MKPTELCNAWRTRLNRDGSAPTVDAIRESFLAAGETAHAQIRALELLLATSSPQISADLLGGIRKDVRALRDRSSGGPAESVRVTMLRRRQGELAERLEALRRTDPAHSELQTRVETLSNDQARLRDAVSQLRSEHERLARLHALLGEAET
jgi:hypothetical protein